MLIEWKSATLLRWAMGLGCPLGCSPPLLSCCLPINGCWLGGSLMGVTDPVGMGWGVKDCLPPLPPPLPPTFPSTDSTFTLRELWLRSLLLPLLPWGDSSVFESDRFNLLGFPPDPWEEPAALKVTISSLNSVTDYWNKDKRWWQMMIICILPGRKWWSLYHAYQQSLAFLSPHFQLLMDKSCSKVI